MRFRVEDGEPFQRISPADVGLPLKRDDMMPAADVEVTLADIMRHEAQRAFNLELGLLIRGRLMCLGGDDHVLPVTMHHLVWALKIPTRELSQLYAAAREDRDAVAGAYPDYAILMHSL
ncbi:MAG: hypothetical protein E5X72_29930 [Mesorhizobium sp.]|uniref:condensation domain-containing protein n=1 Tax=Mesorhizobium sp. TaxID=1871066 RepID=UPI00121595CC|nr:condensation domain-containing protein [Mesorhizobium sp.]TIP00453.1 MAG: hypothetical protein E5X72_29930 [Mesorhizobium sp.]